MDKRIADALSRLPPLDYQNRMVERRTCKICGSLASSYDVVDFNKICTVTDDSYMYGFAGIPIYYYRCDDCSFLFTDFFDDWTPQEFRQFVYNHDYLKVDPEYVAIRPRQTAVTMAELLCNRQDAAILDYGSGSGAFAEELQAHGFKCVESYDPFSNARMPAGKFDIITAIEVVEHSPAPLALFSEIQERLNDGGCLIIAECLQPDNIAELRGNWWYIGPRNGHVSTYSDETLSVLARRLGMRFYKGASVHGFSQPHPTDANREVLERIGPPFDVARLTGDRAIGYRQPHPDWHNPEKGAAGYFRWTASARLVWPGCNFATGVTAVRIPFIAAIERNFVERAEIRIGDREIPRVVCDREITAEIEFPTGCSHDVELLTPEPRSPLETRGFPDSRKLGLAIRFRDPTVGVPG
jgi:SAM-dependent methyltransferase